MIEIERGIHHTSGNGKIEFIRIREDASRVEDGGDEETACLGTSLGEIGRGSAYVIDKEEMGWSKVRAYSN